MINYNFCKYAEGKKDYSFTKCYNCTKACPSISNLVWKIPIIKHITKFYHYIKRNIECKQFQKNYINKYENKKVKFIWGIKSWDDLTDNDCNLYTMNDFDIVYHKNTQDYTINVETIYMFISENGDKDYLKSILNKFTEWMMNNGYNIEQKPSLYNVFTAGYNIKTHFKTIDECYTYFKMLVSGYCNGR